jgi:hypothetical protein
MGNFQHSKLQVPKPEVICEYCIQLAVFIKILQTRHGIHPSFGIHNVTTVRMQGLTFCLVLDL